MHIPKWCLFYDFHTMPTFPDLGKRFDIDAFTDRVKGCGVDYLVFHARCNQGMAYYNTVEGTRHYSLDYDLFGKLAESCSRKGIKLGAYLNVGLSHNEALLHREWSVMRPDGPQVVPDNVRATLFCRAMCYNTTYGEHFLKMVKEVATNYDIAGMFFDCMQARPCIGVECVREMKEMGMNPNNAGDTFEFSVFSTKRMAERIAGTVNSIKPGMLLYFGMDHEDQQKSGTYLECECLPNGGWGYEYLPIYSRNMRTYGKHVMNMTGTFHQSWGDFGNVRPQAALDYDCMYGLAQGLRPTIGGHYHPRGDINEDAFRLIENTYGRLQHYEDWYDNALPVVDFAIICPKNYKEHSTLNFWNPEIRGAVRMLEELKCQFNVLSEDQDWDGYKLLILPDELVLNEKAATKIRRHLDNGDAIISSGHSGLDKDGKKFVFQDWGLEYLGESPYDPAYLTVEKRIADGMPVMPATLYEKGTQVKASGNTQTLGWITAPYYNRGWDGEQVYYYLPPKDRTDMPAITLNGRIAHFTHPVFRTYFKRAPLSLRQAVSNILNILLPKPVLKADGLPSFGRATVTAQPNRKMVHLLAYVPERRGEIIDTIEEPADVRNVKISLRHNNEIPLKAYLAPDRSPLDFTVNGDYVETVLPFMSGYAVLVFEK